MISASIKSYSFLSKQPSAQQGSAQGKQGDESQPLEHGCSFSIVALSGFNMA